MKSVFLSALLLVLFACAARAQLTASDLAGGWRSANCETLSDSEGIYRVRTFVFNSNNYDFVTTLYSDEQCDSLLGTVEEEGSISLGGDVNGGTLITFDVDSRTLFAADAAAVTFFDNLPDNLPEFNSSCVDASSLQPNQPYDVTDATCLVLQYFGVSDCPTGALNLVAVDGNELQMAEITDVNEICTGGPDQLDPDNPLLRIRRGGDDDGDDLVVNTVIPLTIVGGVVIIILIAVAIAVTVYCIYTKTHDSGW